MSVISFCQHWILCKVFMTNSFLFFFKLFILYWSIASCEELTHWKRLWCWEGLEAEGEGDDRGWDGWMASPTRWTWVWVNSGSWWWTERPGVLRFMGLQRVGHDWATELNRNTGGNTQMNIYLISKKYNYFFDLKISHTFWFLCISNHITIYSWLSKKAGYWYICVSSQAQLVENLPAMQKTWVRSLGCKGPLEKGMDTHSSTLSTEE